MFIVKSRHFRFSDWTSGVFINIKDFISGHLFRYGGTNIRWRKLKVLFIFPPNLHFSSGDRNSLNSRHHLRPRKHGETPFNPSSLGESCKVVETSSSFRRGISSVLIDQQVLWCEIPLLVTERTLNQDSVVLETSFFFFTRSKIPHFVIKTRFFSVIPIIKTHCSQ